MQQESKNTQTVSLLVYGTQLRTSPLNAKRGSVMTGGAGSDWSNDTEELSVSMLDLSPNVFDPNDPDKRPLGELSVSVSVSVSVIHSLAICYHQHI